MPSKSAQQKHTRRPQQHRQEKLRKFMIEEKHLNDDKIFTEQLALEVKKVMVELNQERERLWQREWEMERRGYHGGRTCGERETDITEVNIAYGKLMLDYIYE